MHSEDHERAIVANDDIDRLADWTMFNGIANQIRSDLGEPCSIQVCVAVALDLEM